MGRGTILIKMYNGMTRTWINVRLVSNLKQNCISLSNLESLWWKYTGVRVLKVSKGALVLVLWKFVHVGRMYYYMFSSNVIILSNSHVTKLWHMRLGHMSDEGMAILSNRGFYVPKSANKMEFCWHCPLGKQK